MEFVPFVTNAEYIEKEDRLIKFEASDLPKPGEGFVRFFEAMNADEQISPEQFDAGVVKTYGHDPESPAAVAPKSGGSVHRAEDA